MKKNKLLTLLYRFHYSGIDNLDQSIFLKTWVRSTVIGRMISLKVPTLKREHEKKRSTKN